MKPHPLIVEIHLFESLQPDWTAWFDGLELEEDPQGGVRLCGTVPDQSALFGLLERLRDLNLRLESIQVRESSN